MGLDAVDLVLVLDFDVFRLCQVDSGVMSAEPLLRSDQARFSAACPENLASGQQEFVGLLRRSSDHNLTIAVRC